MKYKYQVQKSHMGKCVGNSHQRRLAHRASGRYGAAIAEGLRLAERAITERHFRLGFEMSEKTIALE